jgi:hypothetical protein
MNFDNIGLQAPRILLPREGTDMTAWAVVACDQYTSEPEYWRNAGTLVGGKPSTLNLIYPEVYLESGNGPQIISSINRKMREYLSLDVLEEKNPGFVLVDRKTSHAPSRKGLVVALDLECYDYTPGSKTLIRATEGTIIERIPPRVEIRKDAPVELPHIMVLIDDPEKTVIEPLFAEKLEKLYDFDLMADSGSIRGYLVDNEKLLRQVAGNLAKLADQEYFNRKYNVKDKGVMLYAMGDGNHSLATAKAIWEKMKKDAGDPASVMNHPARHALVELVNIHDAGLEFEPIHRVLFNVDAEGLLSGFAAFHEKNGSRVTVRDLPGKAELNTAMRTPGKEGIHAIPFVAGASRGIIEVEKPAKTLVVATLQDYLDPYLKQASGTTIDYVHGAEVVSRLGGKDGNIGFFLPAIDKSSFFRTIIVDGVLPRKTFSMGEADEKRFYLECRRITAGKA